MILGSCNEEDKKVQQPQQKKGGGRRPQGLKGGSGGLKLGSPRSRIKDFNINEEDIEVGKDMELSL